MSKSHLVDRIKLASALQCHVRTISRAVMRAGLGRPVYRSGLALFPADTISRALKIKPQWLNTILADPEECVTPAQAAQMLGMDTRLFTELQSQTGFPLASASWDGRRSKRYSRQEVKRAAKHFKAEAA